MDERQRMAEQAARDMGRVIASECPPGVGFVLALFDFGSSGWATYFSNASRMDAAKFLRELAAEIEGR